MTTQPKENRLINDDAADEVVEDRRRPVAPDRPTPTRQLRANRGGSSYPGRRKITSYIDAKLFLALKTISVMTDLPMVALQEQAIRLLVDRYNAQKKFGQ